MRLADVIASAQILSIAFIAGKGLIFVVNFQRVVAKIRPLSVWKDKSTIILTDCR